MILRKKAGSRGAFAAGAVGCAILAGSFSFAFAQTPDKETELRKIVAKIEKRLADQDRRLKAQQGQISQQAAVLERQRQELARLHGLADKKALAISVIDASRARGTNVNVIDASTGGSAAAQDAGQPGGQDQGAAAADNTPLAPVGETQKQEPAPQIIQSLPEGLAVLTPETHFVFTPSFEYTNTTNDRLVYRGVVIVPGLNLGEVEASNDQRNIISTVLDVRYGLTPRLEIEARVPFVFSDDRATILSQGPNGSATQSVYISGRGMGDVELGARYQVNAGAEDWPIFVANLRLKSDTGTGPFGVQRDAAGVAQEVALGSGFMAVEGGFSMLKVSEPAVLFASLNYVYSLAKNINQTIGTVPVGEVDPSDSISATIGFGFAVNTDFSFSLGYEHSHVFPQYTMLGTTQQATTAFEVGALSLGMAYRIAPNMSLNGNFEFGVTANAPDVRAVFSLPISY